MPPYSSLSADLTQPGENTADFVVTVPVSIKTLTKRSDFLKAAQARRAGGGGFLLQGRQRGPDEVSGTDIRIGYTCSRKIGNAVARNRAKRRLRALAREIMPTQARPGWDYVLVGRPGETIARSFDALRDDLHAALRRVHQSRQSK